ncbi:MAG: phosphoribosylanthranilate isomerase [Pseudomonadota bacterium]
MATPFKVCCIASYEEARLAIEAGADAIGLVAEMVNGPGILDDDQITEISAAVAASHGDRVRRVLLTSRVEADAIAAHIAETGVNAVQLVDRTSPEIRRAVKEAHPDVFLFQVVHVTGERAIDEALEAAIASDALLLDSGKPDADEKTFGGTGETHDWAVSAAIVAAADLPVYLAGGLTSDNINDALARVRPHGVDICSGLRDKENGYRLVPEKLDAFARALGHGR